MSAIMNSTSGEENLTMSSIINSVFTYKTSPWYGLVVAFFHDVKEEPNITCADIIGFAESRLVCRDLDEDYSLPGFAMPIRNDQSQANATTRPYHGLVLYRS
jgi:hypothetical protein